MANTQTASKTAAKRNRSHSKKASAPAALTGQPGDNIAQERRLLLWLYTNAQRIQAAIVSSANRFGENRQFVDMQAELTLASEFGRLCSPPRPQQQQQRVPSQIASPIEQPQQRAAGA